MNQLQAELAAFKEEGSVQDTGNLSQPKNKRYTITIIIPMSLLVVFAAQ